MLYVVLPTVEKTVAEPVANSREAQTINRRGPIDGSQLPPEQISAFSLRVRLDPPMLRKAPDRTLAEPSPLARAAGIVDGDRLTLFGRSERVRERQHFADVIGKNVNGVHFARFLSSDVLDSMSRYTSMASTIISSAWRTAS